MLGLGGDSAVRVFGVLSGVVTLPSPPPDLPGVRCTWADQYNGSPHCSPHVCSLLLEGLLLLSLGVCVCIIGFLFYIVYNVFSDTPLSTARSLL